jgi:hypothetical protein
MMATFYYFSIRYVNKEHNEEENTLSKEGL